jgi:formylglycine-generating enzyme required for sulfatase activity/predicted methyltransferase
MKLAVPAVAGLALLSIAASRGDGAPPTFQDCPVCPRMVALPGGFAVLGSPADEPERHKRERVRHAAKVAPLAVSATEITRAQFRAFVEATGRPMPAGCDTHGDGVDTTSDHDAGASWREPRFAQTDDHPVVCVDWQDAADYAAWLARTTGHAYRLPDDVEWEYAARGGASSAYFWGNDADQACAHMNGGDERLARALPPWRDAVRRDLEAGYAGARLVPCDDGSAFTAAVASYAPNAFGLYDVTGNVWEWVAGCGDAAPESDGACAKRGVRGGSWDDWPMDLRLADRHEVPPATRRNDTGFRVARDIDAASGAAAPATGARPGARPDFVAAVGADGRPPDLVAKDVTRRPAEVLDFLQLRAGMTVLDLIGDAGYYSEIMARAVGPAGRVVALVYDEAARKELAGLQARNANVELLPLAMHSLTEESLPRDSFDFVLLHLLYHDVYWEDAEAGAPRIEPANVLAALYRAVRPGGIVGVVDNVGLPGDTRAIVNALHRIDPARLRSDFEGAGFVFEAESPVLRVPADDHTRNVFDPEVRGSVDTLVYRFRKPERI